MKKRILSFILAVTMVLGCTVTANAATTTWDFTTLVAGDVNIQGTTGSYNGLEIDASNNGKFSSRDNHDVQFNAGTIVYIPVNGDCEIEVVAYKSGDAEVLSFNDEEVGGGNVTVSGSTYVYNYVGSAGTVKMEAIGSTYLYSITVTEPEDPALASVYTYWDFTTGTDENTTIQNDTGSYNGLKIDASNGKFYIRTGDLNINAGTIVEIPVIGNSKIEVVAHNSNYAGYVTFDEKAVGDSSITVNNNTLVYNYEGEAGTVKLGATATTYIWSIRVTSTIQTIGAQTKDNDNTVLGFVTLVSKEEFDAKRDTIAEMGVLVKNSAHPTTAAMTVENASVDGDIRKIVTEWVTDVTVLDNTMSNNHTYAFRSLITGITDPNKAYTVVPYITYTNGTTVYGAEVTRTVNMIVES